MTDCFWPLSDNPEAPALPPYPPPARSMGRSFRIFVVLLQILAREYRRTWSLYAFFGLVFPLG